jgi:pheromone shutdown-related protein TraB
VSASEEAVSNVTVVRATRGAEERVFHIVATAHVSKKSVQEVQRVIDELRPDTVCVELCATRYAALTDETRWRKLDVPKIVREGNAGFTLATLTLQAFQRRIGARLGVKPGAELLAATVAAERVGAKLVLADRDVQVTLRRAWNGLRLSSRLKMQALLMATALGGEDVDEAQIEQLKRREHASDMMAELAKAMPEVKVTLIDERDRYLMSSIEAAPGKVVVAVVGAMHVHGMLQHLGADVDRADLERIPPRPWRAELRRWLLPLASAGALGWALMGGRPWWSLLEGWAIATAAGAALGTAGVGGHPLSALVAALLAPVLSLVPVRRLGAVVGGVEARLRKPTPDDGERLGRDVTNLKSALGNAATRTLLVSVVSHAGAALGAAAGTLWLLWSAWRD